MINTMEYLFYFANKPILTKRMGLVFLVKRNKNLKAHANKKCKELEGSETIYELAVSLDNTDLELRLCTTCFRI